MNAWSTKKNIFNSCHPLNFLSLNTLHCIWQGIVPIRRSVFWCNCVRCMSTAVHLSSSLGWGQASPEECFIHFAVAWKPNSLLRRCSSPLPKIQYRVLKIWCKACTILWNSVMGKSECLSHSAWKHISLCFRTWMMLIQLLHSNSDNTIMIHVH